MWYGHIMKNKEVPELLKERKFAVSPISYLPINNHKTGNHGTL